MADGLGVVFCGMNPGLTTALVGHHFASPGNRFWPALAHAGFTPETFTPDRERELLPLGMGLTNLVERATRDISELSREDLEAGGERLRAEMERYRPAWLAFLGLTGFRTAFGVKGASVGPRAERIGPTRVWLLPNPSGRNAHWKPPELAQEYARLREAAGLPDRSA
ncbi:G/U mismatch-specific DNA glycosylase [Nocardiopsis sp. HNM0947]|uniref:G/U mismatch-specific DNA glycosylase n=2 Tax=Nocardiopsis coralli TaxID=2772213 RepID=A0ABR9P2H0_9ACTN|nr:G/U mismatch-specific DNA glycosylase [Nocardiopsis coralli]